MRNVLSRVFIPSMVLAVMVLTLNACNGKASVDDSVDTIDTAVIGSEELFEVAFSAMQLKADELGLKGVAMAAFLEDTTSLDWRMATRVMGRVEFPHGENPGWNIIAMVGSKIGESMLTHAPSGHCPRPLLHGEVGFANAEDPLNGEGAEFLDLDGAWCVCAFGGGPHEKDYMIGSAGAKAMKEAYEQR